VIMNFETYVQFGFKFLGALSFACGTSYCGIGLPGISEECTASVYRVYEESRQATDRSNDQAIKHVVIYAYDITGWQ
jgi:hypothetical protein